MPEFYDARLTARSFALYNSVRVWAAGRSDVTVWGGWAVYELVKPPMNHRSRDVDLVFHTIDGLDQFVDGPPAKRGYVVPRGSPNHHVLP